jgi:hypothetical protein
MALFLGSIWMQWLRARKRQRLVRLVNPELLAASDRVKWISVDRSFDFLFKDFRKLQILKSNLEYMPESVRHRWNRYRRFSRFEMAVTASMLIFAATAFLICGS